MHLDKLTKKLGSKINLIKRFKALKVKNRTRLSLIIFKTVVRSLYDYSFVILSCDIQRISKNLQIIQNKILRSIKFFPLKTSINSIHQDLKIDTIEARTQKLLRSFIYSKDGTDLIPPAIEIHKRNQPAPKQRFQTVFDRIIY